MGAFGCGVVVADEILTSGWFRYQTTLLLLNVTFKRSTAFNEALNVDPYSFINDLWPSF